MPPDNSGPAPLKPYRLVRPPLETAVTVPVKFLYAGISPWQVNPALQIYPLDLSILTYDEYCEIWQVSAKAREAREVRGLPLEGPFPWPSTVFWQLLKAGQRACKRQKTS
ncbi:MAG: uncharacterized protein KVP18_002724 [Porospora cf. gigantea A]|nr:MAG: hypothetical protein KVP18_002724 [Porospora cf. gigantea A]